MPSMQLNIQMAGIGDYIFLIVIVISVISQLIGKSKKNLLEDEQQGAPQKRHPFDDEEYETPTVFTPSIDPFGQEGRMATAEGTPSVVGREAVKPKVKKSAQRERVVETMAKQYSARQIAEMESRIKEGQRGIYDPIKDGAISSAVPQKQRRQFNLRQAVIQTEILHRKYS